MEHVVQFGINIDDDRISQAVVNEATKQAELVDILKNRKAFKDKLVEAEV